MFYIFEYELESLAAASAESSLNYTITGIAVGAMISLWITMATVDIQNPTTKALIFAAALLATVLSVAFGVKSIFSFFAAKRSVQAIKDASPERKRQAMG